MLIKLVQSQDQNDKEGVVKVGRVKTVIPAGQTRDVKCHVRTGPLSIKQEVLFDPEKSLLQKRFQRGQRGCTFLRLLFVCRRETGLKLQSLSLTIVNMIRLSIHAQYWVSYSK